LLFWLELVLVLVEAEERGRARAERVEMIDDGMNSHGSRRFQLLQYYKRDIFAST
jgi:hypothetical protein